MSTLLACDHTVSGEEIHSRRCAGAYESWLQPIELIWARVKHRVAEQSKLGRSWQETAEQTKAALKAVTPELCQKMIAHTERLMNEWLQSDEAGSLKQYGSLEALSRLTPQQRAACTDLNVPDTVMTGVVDAEKENPVRMEA